MENLLKKHFNKINLDIRKKAPGYSRFMDQKVTPDVLSFVADCIVNFLGGKDAKTIFTAGDIWKFPYFVKNTIAVFGKPSPENRTASSEYDKFIAQPLKTLAFAKSLEEKKVGRKNSYVVLRPDILEFISRNERNALLFLVHYIEKTLADSGFLGRFNKYKTKAESGSLSTKDFALLKKEFRAFMRGYTEINGDTEINRIFPKVLNPYAASYQIPGTEGGYMTTGRFIFSDLMYNRQNFRDIRKDKTQSRKEALDKINNRRKIVAYRVQRAKNAIKRYHSSSEMKDSLAVGKATQAHHIFPEKKFREISDYPENLILLTAQQHNTRAHFDNHYQEGEPEYSKECLLSKIDSIFESIRKKDGFYSKEKFIHVLNVGYNLSLSTSVSLDELKKIIQKHS